MTTSVQSPADVVNLALVRIGHPLRIGSLFDGTKAAKRSLDIYGQTRDELLTELRPEFAQRDASLNLLKTAPAGGYVPPTVWTTAYPPVPWIYEYALPADYLEVGALKGSPAVIPTFLPMPKVFRIQNDEALDPPAKVLLCNVGSAILTYIARITDPTTWDPAFVESLAASLARRLTVALADPRLLQAEAQDEGAQIALAAVERA